MRFVLIRYWNRKRRLFLCKTQLFLFQILCPARHDTRAKNYKIKQECNKNKTWHLLFCARSFCSLIWSFYCIFSAAKQQTVSVVHEVICLKIDFKSVKKKNNPLTWCLPVITALLGRDHPECAATPGTLCAAHSSSYSLSRSGLTY